jgi:hypothetical protein
MDWMLNTATWEIKSGKRAPQMCTISIGFQPIHDIAPGLDADGMMRTTVYGVGGPSSNIQGDPHGDFGAAGGGASGEVDPF